MISVFKNFNRYRQDPPNVWQTRFFEGDVHFDNLTNTWYVYSDTGWQKIEENYTATLSPATQAVIDWATRKMHEEQKLQELRLQYPTLDEALKDLETIKAVVASYES